MNHVILKHAAPCELLTDRGRAIFSRAVSEILYLFAIFRKPTTAYHVQINVLPERLSRALANMLSMYVAANHRHCDAALTFILFGYNCPGQDITAFSPFSLLYGREPAHLIHLFLPFPPDSILTEYMSDTIHRAEDARFRSRQRPHDSQQRQCARHHDKTSPWSELFC